MGLKSNSIAATAPSLPLHPSWVHLLHNPPSRRCCRCCCLCFCFCPCRRPSIRSCRNHRCRFLHWPPQVGVSPVLCQRQMIHLLYCQAHQAECVCHRVLRRGRHCTHGHQQSKAGVASARERHRRAAQEEEQQMSTALHSTAKGCAALATCTGTCTAPLYKTLRCISCSPPARPPTHLPTHPPTHLA